MYSQAITYEVDENGIAVVYIDNPESDVNRISKAFLKRLYLVLTGIRDDQDVRGVIFYSLKKDSFIENYEINELQELRNTSSALKLAQFGQSVTTALSNLPFPTLAAINGACRGAGLEISLACKKRICTFSRSTKFAFPDIQIGICPFMGGTQRLPRLIGLKNSLDLLLSGRIINVEEAKAFKLVNQVVNHTDFLEIAKNNMHDMIMESELSIMDRLRIFTQKFEPVQLAENLYSLKWSYDLLEQSLPGRYIIGYQSLHRFKKQTLKKYHSIQIISNAVQKSQSSNLGSGLLFEAQCFSNLLNDKVTRNLIFLHKLKEDYLGRENASPQSVVSVSQPYSFIIGAGYYGGTIAGLIASTGGKVRLKDTDPQSISRGLRAARAFLEYRAKVDQTSSQDIDEKMRLISSTLDYSGLRGADFVVEALPEQLTIKREVLSEIKPLLKDQAVVFTTTSILPFHYLSVASGRPEKFAGLHFLPPVDRNPMVEVISDTKTSPETIDISLSFMEKLHKIPFKIIDSPGYLINRILAPYLIEAILLMEEGARAETIEKIMEDFGMEAGPLRILDEIGIDQAQSIGQILFFQFGERFRLPRSLKVILTEKRMGRSSGLGFYLYSPDGQALGIDPKINKLLKLYQTYRIKLSPKLIEQRLVFMLLNEAARCAAENIVASMRDIDLAMVFAKLFPAFLGGPLRYIDSLGVPNLVREMDRLAGQFGDRFEPTSLLTEYSSRNIKFYKPH
ncbi:3-hydroxyacyl-CoA dehydrogenase NAD-binding domain-containing protein [candidate division CSSED10-310 bacterium]|uniref:3-hydroxyacyl-CoA dehydrogenase NAD-binding domain-containing protein n=1 Tax=candidate division CSSED10-310 bacterium TaxID=2855610 RepID=A0ABV6YYJ3_UNCC1